MNKKDNRIAAIFAANLNPLIDAADLDVHSLLDAIWSLDRQYARTEGLAIGAKAESAACCDNRQHGNSKQAGLGDPEYPAFHRRAAPDDRFDHHRGMIAGRANLWHQSEGMTTKRQVIRVAPISSYLERWEARTSPVIPRWRYGVCMDQGASKPFTAKACLNAGEVKNVINAFASSVCLLPELIPATYKA
jgi:hypothetical protein